MTLRAARREIFIEKEQDKRLPAKSKQLLRFRWLICEGYAGSANISCLRHEDHQIYAASILLSRHSRLISVA